MPKTHGVHTLLPVPVIQARDKHSKEARLNRAYELLVSVQAEFYDTAAEPRIAGVLVLLKEIPSVMPEVEHD